MHSKVIPQRSQGILKEVFIGSTNAMNPQSMDLFHYAIMKR